MHNQQRYKDLEMPDLALSKMGTPNKMNISIPRRGREKLAVFPERIATFGATKELRRRLIGTSCLNLPDICSIISTFWAFNSYGRERSQFLLFFSYYRYKLLWSMLDNFSRFRFGFLILFLLLVTAFRA
jgi:hypothetical protein